MAVTVAAVSFVVWSLFQSANGATLDWPTPTGWLMHFGRAALYGAALGLVAAGWLAMLTVGSRTVPINRSFAIFAISQLYKYLPSNLLHFVGRHLHLKRIGVSQAAASFGTAGEILLLPAAAAGVALVAGWSTRDGPDDRLLGIIVVGLLLVSAGAYAGSLALRWWQGRRQPGNGLAEIGMGQLLRSVAPALLAFAAFFVLSGLIFASVAVSPDQWSLETVALLIAIWSSSWALGYVTPGAPGGLGVREALLIAALTATGHAEGASQTAIVMRLVTLIGDVLFAGLGWIMQTIAVPAPRLVEQPPAYRFK